MDELFPMNDPAYARTYAEESALVDASELIAEAMEHAGMSQADLARALNVSRGEISARLRGDRNMTLRKLAATLHVLGSRLELGMHTGSRASQLPEMKDDVVQLSYERMRRKPAQQIVFGDHVGHHALPVEPNHVATYVRRMAGARS